jgi:ATP-dependent DNA helicase RecQ
VNPSVDFRDGQWEAIDQLLSGDEEEDINAYFRETAFPPEWQVTRILEALDACEDSGMTMRALEHAVNLRQTQIEKVLKLLVVEDAAPVVNIGSRWSRTASPFQLDRQRIEHLTHQREQEWAQMQAYIAGEQCLMQFLSAALDDPVAQPCGRCAVCRGEPVVSTAISAERLLRAQRFVRQSEMPLELKKQWDLSALPAYVAEFGWTKAARELGDDLVNASVELIRTRWPMDPAPAWLTCIPSTRHPDLVPEFARRLAVAL